MMKPAERYSYRLLMDKLTSKPESVRWRDLVSDPRVPHPAAEREQLLQIGTAAYPSSGTDPFKHWQRPWFFWTVLKAGIILIVSCFALVYGCRLLLNNTTQVAVEMLYLIPPMVIPIVLMIFFWELNVPGNLSIWELLSFFLIGTLISLGGNALMFAVVGTAGGPMAALREEPAKLLAGVVLLLYCSRVKGKRICGLTGLVIGAAVGSGFSAFETISYGLHYNLETVMIRVVFAVVGHTLYSCSYLAALALHAPDGKITIHSFCNPDFLLTFGCSVLCHALWNAAIVSLGVRFAVTLILLWYSALWIIRKALLQLMPQSHGNTPAVPSKEIGNHIELRCLRGEMAGKTWCHSDSQQVMIGRGSINEICLPANINGISRKHCFLEAGTNGWMITDTHSTYGTYLQSPGGRIYRLVPGKKYPLESGMLLYLGSQNFCFGISIF